MFADLKSIFRAALSDRKGVTALEYGVIAATTVVVGMAAFGTIGTNLAGVFATVATKLVP